MNEFKELDDLLNCLAVNLTSADIMEAKLQAQISTELIMYRIDNDMTVKDFAEYMGVNNDIVNKWESSNYCFSVHEIALISSKINRNVEIIFE